MRTSTSVGPALVQRAVRLHEPSAREFAQLAAYIHDVAGIQLPDTKRALMVRRIGGRVLELGLQTFTEYYDLVRADESGAETVRMLDLIATNETHFFREPAHFELLERRIFPTWITEADAGQRSRTIRVWSAACSTGQEPYSLAMQLLTYFPATAGWQIDILATDISTRALRHAESGVWASEKAKEIPERYLKRFMLRGVGEHQGQMRIVSEVRHAVRFERLNLNDESYAVNGSFDLIFCRNVLIYFSNERRAAVIERLSNRLGRGGLLFVGHAESLHGHRSRLVSVAPTVYTRAA